MAPEHKVLVFLLVVSVSFLLGLGIARQIQEQRFTEELASQGIVRLISFEDAQALPGGEIEFARMKSTVPVDRALINVTDGVACLYVNFPAEGGRLSAHRTFEADWSQYKRFAFDVTNAEFREVELQLVVRDGAQKEFRTTLRLPSGASRQAVEVALIGTEIDVADVADIELVAPPIDRGNRRLYIDFLRLEKDVEA